MKGCRKKKKKKNSQPAPPLFSPRPRSPSGPQRLAHHHHCCHSSQPTPPTPSHTPAGSGGRSGTSARKIPAGRARRAAARRARALALRPSARRAGQGHRHRHHLRPPLIRPLLQLLSRRRAASRWTRRPRQRRQMPAPRRSMPARGAPRNTGPPGRAGPTPWPGPPGYRLAVAAAACGAWSGCAYGGEGARGGRPGKKTKVFFEATRRAFF
jgi:hypothetical protein